jgi:hypothetical protein
VPIRDANDQAPIGLTKLSNSARNKAHGDRSKSTAQQFAHNNASERERLVHEQHTSAHA